MNNIKKLLKNKKFRYILIGLLIIIFIPFIPTLGRFVYKEVRNAYFNSKKFYFASDKLSEDVSRYQIDFYNGVDPYNLTINMNSFKNNLTGADADITYEIKYTCSSNIICGSSKDTGIIYSTTNTDQFTISSTPRIQLNDGDRIIIEVEATSTSPYKKTLKGVFIIKVGYYGLSYEISDKENDIYFDLKITNTLEYYRVLEDFSTYHTNDHIDISTYQNLSDAEKTKCASSIIGLSFDPNVVLLDMTDNAYLIADKTTKTKINNYDYINSLEFKIDAIESKIIRFYKVDPTKDYTYPNEGTSIVNVEFK